MNNVHPIFQPIMNMLSPKSISYETACALDLEGTNNAHEPLKDKTMNIDLTIKEERKIQKQIELPYFAKDPCSVMMITKSETILIVRITGDFLGGGIEIHTPESIHYEGQLAMFINAKEISETEFEEQFDKVCDRIFGIMETRHLNLKPSVTEAITEDKNA